MYRAVALFVLQNELINGYELKTFNLIGKLHLIKVTFKYNEALEISEVYLNDINVNEAVRSMEVSNVVSIISTVPEVRQQMVSIQQQMGSKKGIVMDGRDIGTVVFPNAELKLFMTASVDTRAKRRYDELVLKDSKLSIHAVLDNIKSRDFLDSTRKESPLFKADDAIEIDNSNLSKKEQFDLVVKLVNTKLNA